MLIAKRARDSGRIYIGGPRQDTAELGDSVRLSTLDHELCGGKVGVMIGIFPLRDTLQGRVLEGTSRPTLVDGSLNP